MRPRIVRITRTAHEEAKRRHQVEKEAAESLNKKKSDVIWDRITAEVRHLEQSA